MDSFLNMLEHIFSFISSAPTVYLFYTIFMIWVFHLLFEIVRS